MSTASPTPLEYPFDSVPEAGETRTGRFSQGPGGKGFNQAVAARRARCHVQHVGLAVRAFDLEAQPLLGRAGHAPRTALGDHVALAVAHGHVA